MLYWRFLERKDGRYEKLTLCNTDKEGAMSYNGLGKVFRTLYSTNRFAEPYSQVHGIHNTAIPRHLGVRETAS